MKIKFVLNGIPKNIYAEPGENARDLLQREGIITVRNGCDGEGTCGACSIILDGKLVNSCLMVAAQLENKTVYTVEFMSKNRVLSQIQSSLVDAGIVQCGYCSPAMVLAIDNLLRKKNDASKDDVKDALSGIICRCTGYEQVFQAVELAKKRLNDPEYYEKFAPEFRENLKVIGKVKRKIDAAKLVRGEKAYVEDMVDSNACVLKILRSPYAHAYIKNIDVSEAENIPGVVYILTHKNCPDIYYNQAGQGFPEPSPYDRKLIGNKVLHVGDRVAAIVAETMEIAELALSKIKVEYDILKPVLTIEDAAAENAPVIHKSKVEYVLGAPDGLDEYNKNAEPRDGKIIYQFPIHGDPHKNIAAGVEGGIGDIDKGFAEADVIIEREYATKQVQCTPVEPHVVYTKMDGDRLIVHASTQVPWHVRRIVAYICGISENKVRVIKERVGGGFGAKQDIVLEELAAYLTYVTGKPIFFRFNRKEEFIASRTRHVMKVKVKLGAKKDGTLTAVYMDLKANTGPYGAHCLTVPMNACSKSLPLFLCDNVKFKVKTYYSNIAPTGAYQGYGAPKGSFALQTCVAELAEKLGMDHLELIEKNRVRDGVMLEILRCLGEGREGTPQKVSSCGLDEALKKGSEMIKWGIKEESDDEDIKIGKGVVIVQQGSGLPGLDSANAVIKMFGDGTFMLLSGGADLGTGLDTVSVKMASEVLKTPMDYISIISGDTDTTPFDVGAYASSGTYFSGSASLKAAQNMKKLIIKVAAEMLEEKEENIELEYPSKAKGKTGEVTYREIAAYTQSGTGCGQLIASGSFVTDDASFPYGAHFCQVAVNTRTGEIKIQKYYALQDCGTPINPELAIGQIYGGVLKSIGHSMYEEMVYDEDGKCLNSNFLDYKVPMINDLPEDFKVELIDVDDPFGPYGAKSVSEISTNGAAPVIANAIHDAVGIWIREWPFTPEKVLKELGKI